MKHLYFLLFIGIMASNALRAQQTTVISGGNAEASNGSMSFSIGQVVSSAVLNDNGVVAQGVQQPFEIFTIEGLGVLDFEINLTFSIFPNPTTDVVTLQLSQLPESETSYQLFDLKGRLISGALVRETSTSIPMDILSEGTYFIRIESKSEVLKTFKIIKN